MGEANIKYVVKNQLILEGNESSDKIEKKEIYLLVFLFSLTFVTYYLLPSFKNIGILFTFLLFLLTKKQYDYIYLIMVFLYNNAPGGLFSNGLITIDTLGLKIPIIGIFSIVVLIKLLFSKKTINSNFFFKSSLYFYFCWLFFLLIEGFVFGIEGGGKSGGRYIFYYSLTFIIFPVFFIVPQILNNYTLILKTFKILSVLLVVNFLTQLYNIFTLNDLNTIFGGATYIDTDEIIEGEVVLSRPLYFVQGSFFCLFLSMFLLFYEKKKRKKKYLLFVLILSYLTIFITATRGWFIAYSFFIFLSIFSSILNNFQNFRLFISISIIAVFSFITIYSSDKLSKHLDSTFGRLETTLLIGEGDLTAGGTNIRLTERNDPVMARFYEKPITGWGFSKVGIETLDGHVGNQSILMTSGIVGFFIFIFILLQITIKLFILSKISNLENKKVAIYIIIISLFALIIIHSSSAQVFGYLRYVRDYGLGAFFVAIFLSIVNILYWEIKKSNLE